jgi:hypothetical protein
VKRLILTVLLFAAFTLPAYAQEKFSLSMFHFNVQYVAGGLVGFLGDTGELGLGLDAEQVENRIITESFFPLLTLLENHPDWKLTLEFQGYMLELITERFPEDLARLKALAEDEAIEIAREIKEFPLVIFEPLVYPEGGMPSPDPEPVSGCSCNISNDSSPASGLIIALLIFAGWLFIPGKEKRAR